MKRSILLSVLVSAMVGATSAAAAEPIKDPLYGDPSRPNISGMWNPEFAYFGPPVGGATARPPAGGTPPAGAPPRGAGGGIPGGGAATAGAPGGGAPGAGPPRGPFTPPMPKLKPAYAARFAEWKRKFDLDGSQEPDTVTRCLAFGIARFGTMPVEIIQTPGQITMNLGVLRDIRRIYLDGGHTEDADPSFSGDSIGRWEGDTLIVETNNVRPGQIDRNGVPYSDKLTAVERIRRTGPARLEIEMTLTDPEAFEEPFNIRRVYVPMPAGSRFEEYVCEYNAEG
jgi:hypothetical protein